MKVQEVSNTTGVSVNEDDILAYYVWIPRYKYKMWSVDNESKTGQEQEIQIVFENKNDISYVPNVDSVISCASLESPTEDNYPVMALHIVLLLSAVVIVLATVVLLFVHSYHMLVDFVIRKLS